MKSNSSHKRVEYRCDLCDGIFHRLLDFNDHRRTHTGEKPFQCDVCGVAFNRRSTLWNHKRVHRDIKPFVCPYCKTSFKWKNSLIFHVGTHLKPKPSSLELNMNRRQEEITADEMNINNVSQLLETKTSVPKGILPQMSPHVQESPSSIESEIQESQKNSETQCSLPFTITFPNVDVKNESGIDSLLPVTW